MVCMEVWGGNAAVDTSVSMAGLDAWVYSKPYESGEGGGDVHYVSSCATGRITRLLIADVSGHGNEVAELGRDLRGLMRRYVNYLDQQKFVKAMNAEFVESSAANVFATAIVTTFFAPTRQLSLCNAGHPPPLLYRADEGEWSFVDADAPEGERSVSNLPLGIVDFSEYEQFEILLRPGDLVVCYTDSLIEALGRDGKQLVTAGLLEVVRSLGKPEARTLVPKLLLAIGSLSPGNLHGDDITVLLFSPNGTGERMTVRDKVMTPFRVMRGIGEGLLGKGRVTMPEMSVINLFGPFVHGVNKLRRGRGKAWK